MQIKDIEIKNYKRFKKFSCEFDARLTLLTGENGTGKTSLLKAIQGGGLAFIRRQVAGGIYESRVTPEDAHFVTEVDVSSESWRTRQFPIEMISNVDTGLESCPLIKSGIRRQANNTFGWLPEERIYNELSNLIGNSFKVGAQNPIPNFLHIPAQKIVGSTTKVDAARPFVEKQDALNQVGTLSINIQLFASWFKHNALRALQEGQEPLIYRTVKSAVLSAIHAEDIKYLVRTDCLEVQYADYGWTPFDDLSDGQQRIAAIFCDLAMRFASINSHLGDQCLKEATGVVTIDELDLHLHPKWQKQVIPDLLKTFPRVQFIVASHSPFLLQAAFEHGKVIDMAKGQFMDAQDTSIEDIAENNMGVEHPQRGARFMAMKDAAQAYYELLERVPAASEAEKVGIKSQLDVLMIPYANDPAYAAFLEMHRVAAGV